MKSWLHSNQWQNSHPLQWSQDFIYICLFSFFLDICNPTIWQAIVCTGQNYSFLFICVRIPVCFLTKKKTNQKTKNTKRVRKCYAYLQCYIIHFIAQSKDEKNCLLHLLGEGQKCKQKG